MSAFPGGLASFTGFTSGHTLLVDTHAAQHNLEQGEILAVQTKVGTGASTPTSSKVLRGSGVGTSSWAQVDLTTDVTGILPQANGGTGTNSATGTGPPVYQSNATILTPTLTTPTIASFTNATHTHQNAAGGGQLLLAALASTFLSTQVTTYTNPGTAGGTNSFFYINIGGIKYFWGITDNQTSNNAAPSYTITLPVGFFTTIQAPLATAINMTGDARQYASVTSATIVTVTVVLNAPNGAATTGASIHVEGT